MSEALDLGVLGHRVRHHRKRQNMTLADLSEGVDKPVPYLSQLENGRIEPKIGLLNNLADTLDVTVAELVDPTPPNKRAELELELLRAQEDPQYQALGLPYLKPNAKLTDDVLEHLVTLWRNIPSSGGGRTLRAEDKARLANAELRLEMREANNYFNAIESVVTEALESTDSRVRDHSPNATSPSSLRTSASESNAPTACRVAPAQ